MLNMKVTKIAAFRSGNSTSYPLFASRPAAGFPAPGDDTVEKALNLNDLLIDNPDATFFVTVEGDSMEGAGIFSGDILVVDRSRTPRHGLIVVAAVYGELVVKRLEQVGSDVRLVSANAAYAPIVLRDNDECYMWGVVVGSVRMFL
jgi:DNA polymerase V